LGVLATGHAESWVTDASHRELIEKALPNEAPARPLKPRRLLIFTLNVGYGGHGSIAYANEAFTALGKKTGAFETEVSNDPEVFRPASLNRFDAVFFNNTVGNCFTNADLRRSLLEFVTGGGGLLGVHGTAVAFTEWPGAKEDWPEFGYVLGGRGANHKDSNERVWIKVEDERHPLTRMFSSQGFEYRDEFFRVHEPYSRDRLRILLSIDLSQTDLSAGGPPRGNCTRADNDYALAWIRNYGRGRVFYSTIAHNPYVFWDPQMLTFYLAALQFALGDLDVPTTPSARLTPARRAQEKLGWRLGVEAYTFHKFTFFEAIEKTARLNLPYIGGLSFQQVSKELPKNFDPELSDEELRQVRMKLEEAGLRLLTYYIHDIPGDPTACRKVFEFGRKMGIETFLSEPKPEALDTIEKFAKEYGINVALHNHNQKASPVYWNPEGLLKACEGRSERVGACGDIGYWLRSGIDPVAAARKLGSRLITVQMHDLNETAQSGHDVPWGTGVSHMEDFVRELHRLKVRPTMIGLEYSHNFLDSLPDIEKSVRFFDQLSEALVTNP
jgi:sugar phosphate isomerase/epimerase/type 1 glutamine amidotransferase